MSTAQQLVDYPENIGPFKLGIGSRYEKRPFSFRFEGVYSTQVEANERGLLKALTKLVADSEFELYESRRRTVLHPEIRVKGGLGDMRYMITAHSNPFVRPYGRTELRVKVKSTEPEHVKAFFDLLSKFQFDDFLRVARGY